MGGEGQGGSGPDDASYKRAQQVPRGHRVLWRVWARGRSPRGWPRRPRAGASSRGSPCGRDGRYRQATGLIGSEPTYTSSAAGQLQDEATYWVAFFAYRHDTLWDYVLRDGLFFFAFLGFIPLALAANVATGGRRAAVQIAAVFIGVGAIFGALNAVTFFVDVSWWRGTGWEQVPPALMDAIGRGTEMMDDLSAWCGIASNAALAVGLTYLGVACLTRASPLATDRLGGPGDGGPRGGHHRGRPDHRPGRGRERPGSRHRRRVRAR